MEKYARSFRATLTAIAQAETYTVNAYIDGRRPYEEDVTSTLLTAIESRLDGKSRHGLRWQGKVTTRAGKHAEEGRSGADFAGILQFNLPDYRIAKGFLAQAKRQEQGDRLALDQWGSLRTQCERMLHITSESFVFVYAYQGISVVSPLSILGCTKPTDLFLLHPIPLREFFKRHFHCFIGDRRIDSATCLPLSNVPELACLTITVND